MVTKNRPGKFPKAGITHVPGLFSDLFNVAASRPAQITTGSRFHSPNRLGLSIGLCIQVTRSMPKRTWLHCRASRDSVIRTPVGACCTHKQVSKDLNLAGRVTVPDPRE